MAQQDFGCYVVNPISGTNLIQGLAQIAAQGTPVVNIDSPVEEDAADKAGTPRHAGHRGDLAIGRDPAKGDAADYGVDAAIEPDPVTRPLHGKSFP